MTKDEIMAMKPGRELDALVAEKVMGWGKHCNWYATGNGVILSNDLKFSTDIAAAFEVVEKLNILFPHHYVNIRQGKDMGGCEVCIEHHYDHTLLVVTFQDTMPHAICLAALLAVEVEHEQG